MGLRWKRFQSGGSVTGSLGSMGTTDAGPIRVGVLGVAGRMGRAVADAVHDADGLVLAAAVAGCTVVGPNYERPTVDSPPAWRIDYAQSADVANTLWWRQFDDPVLDGLIEQATRVVAQVDNQAVKIAFILELDNSLFNFVPGPTLELRDTEVSEPVFQVSLPNTGNLDDFSCQCQGCRC